MSDDSAHTEDAFSIVQKNSSPLIPAVSYRWNANLDGTIDQTDLTVVSNALSSKYYTVFEYIVHSYEKYPTNA